MPFYILQDEAPAPGLRRIAHEQIGIAVGMFADDAVPLDRQVHSLRARCKKMRGLLRLPRPMMGEAFDEHDQQFRAAAKELAGHRDMDVIAKTIESLGGSKNDVHTRRTPIPAAAISRSIEIMNGCRDAVDDWPLDVDGFDDLAPGMSRTYEKCLATWAAILREASDANFHLLRKMTKYHWYHVRILERLNKQEIRKQRKKLRDLQLTLGSAHDLAMLQSYLESQDDLDLQLLQRAITRKRELYVHATRIAGEVYARPADELISDYSRWWDESRGRH